MRHLVFLAAIPLALGCAQQSAFRAPHLPTDDPLEVRLHQPSAGALNYTLSEPGYVAIFAVTRGHGISLLYPYYQSQVEYRSHAGLNQETVHGGTVGFGYTAGARYEHRALFGHADAYYVIASKYPLPVEGMLQSPYLLRSLMGADAFRATSLNGVGDALEAILVSDLPDDSWSSDLYMNWRDPFLSLASWQPASAYGYCGGANSFYGTSVLQMECSSNRPLARGLPPAAAPGVPVAEEPPAAVPKRPRDREPGIPMDPPLASRVAREPIRSEPVRPVERERSVTRERAPEPARPAEARPSAPAPQPASPAESRRPEPQPDP
ncbi:MAG TPA: hypothetical protein VMY38_06940 [Gemmatimonadaceae bacterium]|nr:hypothetical protein [Gemmatimonadaceae bacterium]